jgi:hypothetical protein
LVLRCFSIRRSTGICTLTLFQKDRSFSSRSPGTLPAMIAALIAPIEMPAIQSGSIFCSLSASKAPAW